MQELLKFLCFHQGLSEDAGSSSAAVHSGGGAASPGFF